MKSGMIAIVGRANAGKSTLLNKLVGEKVSIVSPKPQTTRDNIVGVMNEDGYQAVFIDTPGIHSPQDGLGNYMMKSAQAASRDVAGILLVIDATKGLGGAELGHLDKLIRDGSQVIAVLSKIDLIRPEKLLPILQRLNEIKQLVAVVPVSCYKNLNITELKKEIFKLLTDDVQYYPEDMVTDKSSRFMAAEIIRESILYRYNQEVPHGVGVSINKFDFDEKRNLYEIDADIVCEKQSHKAILIGKGGEALKGAVTAAREKLESYLGAKVFLTPWVRVKEDWRNRESLMREFGYDKRELE